jgi:DNA-binding NarL/FixJ family response regulator
MRVVIYSPVRLFGEGIGVFLKEIEHIKAVLVEHNAVDLDTSVANFHADIALFDVTTFDVIPVAHKVRAQCPNTIIVALAVAEVAEKVIACADAGFAAYIPRSASAPEMIAIMDRAVLGETVCDRRIARSLFEELARRRATAAQPFQGEKLTAREREIANMMWRGLSNKEIAKELQLSVATIKNYVHAILGKLQLRRRSQVADFAVENPWALRFPQHGLSHPEVDAECMTDKQNSSSAPVHG